MDLKPDMILLCETWCNNNTNIASLSINGYEIVTDLRRDRCDTANGIGGGLIVYVREDLAVLLCDQSSEFNQYGTVSSKLVIKVTATTYIWSTGPLVLEQPAKTNCVIC